MAGFQLLLLPGLVMMAGGALLFVLRGPFRDVVALALPLAVLALVWLLPEGTSAPLRWLGYDLVPYRSDALSRLFGSAFAIAAFAAGLFGLRQPQRLETPTAYLYAGGAIGVAFAGDLLTFFVFWEVMAVCATAVVWLGGPQSRAAGQRYIVVHLLGGMLLMAGIAGHVATTGSIAFGAMTPDSIATWLILLGFLINVAAWPMSSWVPDAYPSASWSGTVFLSSFTTKAAVLALIRGFPGAEVLVPIGAVMIVYGTVYAIREGDIRRLVAYALVAQLGFMVTAVGVGSDLAINGAAAHAVSGVFYQALLFMVAGSVVVATGRSALADLGGLGRAMPFTAACAVVGALAIAAFPLTSGYVAKGMISDAVAAGGEPVAWFIVTAGAAAAVLHAGLRMPWLVFFSPGPPVAGAADPAPAMRLAMALLAAVTLAIGIFPSTFMAFLPRIAETEPYSASHVVGQVQLLAFATLGMALMWRWLAPPRGITLDVDWLWRRLGPSLLAVLGAPLGRARDILLVRTWRGGERVVRTLYRHHGPDGVLARGWPTGSMALSVVVLLTAYLAFYYL
jgi:multicomponent Na+:H+ antiporter subunit D